MYLFGLVVSGEKAAPVIEVVEETLDEGAPFIFGAAVRNRVSAVAFGRDLARDCQEFRVRRGG